MKKNIFKKINDGYTIIETMISIAVFLIVLMIGMNSLLNASSLHQKSRDQRSIMDSLSFVMEEMSRNIRTSYNLRCIDGVFDPLSDVSNTPFSCSSGGRAIVFEYTNGTPYDPDLNDEHLEDQWIYKIEEGPSGTDLNIYKSTDGGTSFSQLNPDEIKLDRNSGFYVTGALPPTSSDFQQPLVTIVLVGKITTKGVDTPFSLQTTVSQRIIDAQS
jgi:prepilin-type N-terminal cleavage/methylation domain-containing protein